MARMVLQHLSGFAGAGGLRTDGAISGRPCRHITSRSSTPLRGWTRYRAPLN